MRFSRAFVVVVAVGCGAPRGTDSLVTGGPFAASDRDHDGIADEVDKCPDDPEDRDGWQDEDGCPDLDNDHDGILDQNDKCPNDPEDKDGWQDEDGCPDPDNDHDGILDKDDKCPNEAETYNGFEDEDGCPDKGVVLIHANPPIVERVWFAAGSAQVPKEADALLSAVKSVMAGHPELLLVQVEGHADLQEKAAVPLADKRAQAIVAALVARGVDPKRLRGKGFGGYCPVDPKSGEKNRRGELKVVRTTNGPSTVALGCAAATAAGLVSDPP